MNLFTAKPRKKTQLTKEVNSFSTPFRLTEIQAWVAQSIGKTRDQMEDAAYALSLTSAAAENHYSLGLFMIADGMGGHQHGEVASTLAIQRVSGKLTQSVLEPLRLGQRSFQTAEISESLREAFDSAQEAVLSQVPGGGTTLTLALVIDHQLYFAHVGDSRLYLLEESEPLRQLTHDHSLVRRLAELGQISEDESANHPMRNVLFRALGQAEGFKADLGKLQLTGASILLLCSDGLWGEVSDERLAEVLRLEPGAQAVQSLIERANAAGGNDNISAIVVRIA